MSVVGEAEVCFKRRSTDILRWFSWRFSGMLLFEPSTAKLSREQRVPSAHP